MRFIWSFVGRILRLPRSAFSVTAAAGRGNGVPPSVQATIMQLRYWIPTIADVAHVAEQEQEDRWCFILVPRAEGACPLSVTVYESGRLDFTIAGATYTDRALEQLDQLLPLIERITQGHVVQRHWTSCVTGAACGIQTIVSLGRGRAWRDGLAAPEGEAFAHDRHFLPYRRL